MKITQTAIIQFVKKGDQYILEVPDVVFNNIQALLILGGIKMGTTILIRVDEEKK